MPASAHPRPPREIFARGGAALLVSSRQTFPQLSHRYRRTRISSVVVVGAEWGQASPDRTAQRNGYRHRDLDILAKSRLTLVTNNGQEVTDQPLLELSA